MDEQTTNPFALPADFDYLRPLPLAHSLPPSALPGVVTTSSAPAPKAPLGLLPAWMTFWSFFQPDALPVASRLGALWPVSLPAQPIWGISHALFGEVNGLNDTLYQQVLRLHYPNGFGDHGEPPPMNKSGKPNGKR